MCLQRLAVFSISYLKCFCFAVFFGVIFNLHACAFFIVCILLFDCSLCLLLLFFVAFLSLQRLTPCNVFARVGYCT